MKIGLLAMSGIRALDPELVALGLTLPAFVERGRKIAGLPSLGLLQLAACTPPGCELRYFEAPDDGAEPPELYGCDLVAISTFSAQVFEAYAIADRLRARGVRVAMGGLHVSALPEEALEHADYVAVGEGESVWPGIVDAAARGAGQRLLRASDCEPVDIARLPIPRYDLLQGRPYDRITAQSTRGCPYRCEFCASTVMLARPYRKRPVETVARDVRAILAHRPGAFLELADDNTFVDPHWGLELCRALDPLGVRWFTETDVTVADHPELLAAIARAGCRQLLIGVESPSRAALAGIELQSDFKARRAEGAADAIRRIQSHGIAVNACFVLGLDGDGPESFDELLAFVDEAKPYDVQVTVQTPFPGTPLHARLEAEGRILEPGRWDLCTLFDVNYAPRGMSADELRAGLRRLTARLYAPEAVARRRSGFYASLRRARRITRNRIAVVPGLGSAGARPRRKGRARRGEEKRCTRRGPEAGGTA